MHVLGAWIQKQMDRRRWSRADLARASGLNKTVIGQLLNREELRRPISQATVTALAGAFNVPEAVLQVKSAEAIGIPVSSLPQVIVLEPDDDELVEMIRRRLKGGGRRAAAPIDGHEEIKEPAASPPTGNGIAPNPDITTGPDGQPVRSGEHIESGTITPPSRRSRRGEDLEHATEHHQDTAAG